MKFNKAQKAKLKKAGELVVQAQELVNDVKSDYYEGRERNDQYYALDGVEIALAEAIEGVLDQP